jgi:hypothetical protein
MAMRETGKQRKSRIPPDYFKRADWLTTWKLWLSLAAVVLTVGWWGTGWLSSGEIGRLRYSRGPLANVHAMWDAKCSACHQPVTPIDSKSWLASYFGETQASDHKCKTCHAGPKHHQSEIAADVPSCARCHGEHRGRDASLVRTHQANAECLRCHGNLAKHTQNGQTEFDNVTGFHTDHPAFKSPGRTGDPGKLHFSHARHLAAGMPQLTHDGKAPDDAVRIWTYRDIPDESDRLRYWKQQHSDAIPIDLFAPVKLDCASCHGLESDDFDIAGSRRHAAGLHTTAESSKYMLPITYENQCKACHPLTVEQGDADPVPHGLQVNDVQKLLEGVFISRFLTGQPPVASQPGGRPMPGRAVADDPQAARDFIDKEIKNAERYLFQSAAGCKRCHGHETKPLESIESTNVPDSWFKHASFDHAAHRALDCVVCHDKVGTSTTEKDILLPGLKPEPSEKICQQCHAPATGSGHSAKGGARSDCIECHRYHNRDQPHQGIGANARSVRRKAMLSEFLHGNIPHGDQKSPPKP